MAVWKADAPEGLAALARVVHDAYFDSGEVRYDSQARTLLVPFAQEWEGLQLGQDPEWARAPRPEILRRTWRYTEALVPFMRGTLQLEGVESFSADPAAGEAGMLLGLEYDDALSLLVVTGVSGDITAVVDRVAATAELRPNEVALRVRRRRGRFGVLDVPDDPRRRQNSGRP